MLASTDALLADIREAAEFLTLNPTEVRAWHRCRLRDHAPSLLPLSLLALVAPLCLRCADCPLLLTAYFLPITVLCVRQVSKGAVATMYGTNKVLPAEEMEGMLARYIDLLYKVKTVPRAGV